MPSPNVDFRENPSHSVYLSGEITEDTVNHLTPLINTLRTNSPLPITLFIDSRGGSTFHSRMIYGVLKTPTQDGETRRLITVVTGTAASAAADLLAAGDYAIAYPHAFILFHGTRQRLAQQQVTKEYASSLMEHLKETNEGFALQLANRAFRRFFFRYLVVKPSFDELRNELGEPDMEDVECVAELLKRNLDDPGITERALKQYRRFRQLDSYMYSRYEKSTRHFATPGKFEAWLLRNLIKYELKENAKDPSWSFSEAGFEQMEQDFLVLRDYHGGEHAKNIEKLVAQWGPFCLDQTQQKEYAALAADKREDWLNSKTGDNVQALWYFFVSICRFLQEGENGLSAENAYYLGLVDEVVGRSDLPCFRVMIESQTPASTPEDGFGAQSEAHDSDHTPAVTSVTPDTQPISIAASEAPGGPPPTAVSQPSTN